MFNSQLRKPALKGRYKIAMCVAHRNGRIDFINDIIPMALHPSLWYLAPSGLRTPSPNTAQIILSPIFFTPEKLIPILNKILNQFINSISNNKKTTKKS